MRCKMLILFAAIVLYSGLSWAGVFDNGKVLKDGDIHSQAGWKEGEYKKLCIDGKAYLWVKMGKENIVMTPVWQDSGGQPRIESCSSY